MYKERFCHSYAEFIGLVQMMNRRQQSYRWLKQGNKYLIMYWSHF
jgi:hypothetical protein